MNADSSRAPGTFRTLGERLLRDAFPAKNAEEVERYLDRATARVRVVVSTKPSRGGPALPPGTAADAGARFRPAELIDHLASDPIRKLRVRHPARRFADSADLVRALEEAGRTTTAVALPARSTADLAHEAASDSAEDRDRISMLGASLAYATGLARDLIRFVDLAIDAAIEMAVNLGDRSLGRRLAFARETARQLERGLGLDHVLAHDLVQDLRCGRPVNRYRADYATIDRDRDRTYLSRLVNYLTPATEIARRLREAHAEDLLQALDVRRQLNLDELDVEVVRTLRQTVNDLAGADLRHVELAGVDLEGVRWSPATRWPEEWRDQIERDSLTVGPDLYEIRPGMNTADNDLALTPL